MTSTIPDWLCEMTTLTKLGFLDNVMLSGPIPSCIGKLTGLTQFDAKNCHFSGDITGLFDRFTKLDDFSSDKTSRPTTVLHKTYQSKTTTASKSKTTTASKPKPTTVAKPKTTTVSKPKTTTTTKVTVTNYGPCYPTTLNKYLTRPTASPTPNAWGSKGDLPGSQCDSVKFKQAHCVGACMASCPASKWSFDLCGAGMVCKSDNYGIAACVKP
ncbi:hypothetical protein HDU76_008339 [Blyttiomyces sp. JEL0837]|nr:hypothetical protein HDU76_008339 [Blyttiomyces sp. JEL0837]